MFIETCITIQTNAFLALHPPTIEMRNKVKEEIPDIYRKLSEIYDSMKYIKAGPPIRKPPLTCNSEREWKVEWYVFTTSIDKLDNLAATQKDLSRARPAIERTLRILADAIRRIQKLR